MSRYLGPDWSQYEPCHDHDLWVHLSPAQIEAAIHHGMRMRRTSLARGHKDHKGYEHRPPTPIMAMRTQCLASLTEAVVREAFGYECELTSETYNVPDLPNDEQVRLIGVERYGLRVYPTDEGRWKVIGVVIPKGKERVSPYRIPGWIYAHEAHQRSEWQIAPHGGPPMWAVPQKHLRDLRELIE